MSADYTLDEQIAAVKREIGLREKLYPRWVSMQRMSQQKADEGIAAMRSVLHTLEQLQRDEQAALSHM